MTKDTMISRTLMFILTLFACFHSQASSINILKNSGFKSGDTSSWILGGNSLNTGVALDSTLINGTSPVFGAGYTNVRNGNYSAFGTVAAKTIPDQIFFSLSQSIEVMPDTTYDIGFFIGVNHDNPSGYEYRWGKGWTTYDEWINISINGAGLLPRIGFPTIKSGDGVNDFQQVSTTFKTDSNQSELTVEYRVTASGTGLAGFSVDDLYFCPSGKAGDCFPSAGSISTVPEPAAIWLFISGFFK